MRPALLALDLDGTLLDEGSRLPSAHEEVVRWVRSQGTPVAIVTGRPLLTTRWVHERLQLDTPVVCFNGVWVGVPGEAPLAAEVLSEAEVRQVVAALADLDGSICVYPDAERWVIHRYTPRTRDWQRHYGVTITEDASVLADWKGPSCKIMFVTDPERLRSALEVVRARLGSAFHIVPSQDDRIEIHRPQVTKAWGLAVLCEVLGVPQEGVWAVGDALNDLEMVQWAGMGCAMGHAPAALRAAARLVLPPISAGGLAALRDHMAPFYAGA